MLSFGLSFSLMLTSEDTSVRHSTASFHFPERSPRTLPPHLSSLWSDAMFRGGGGGTERVRVFCRVRPRLSRERDGEDDFDDALDLDPELGVVRVRRNR